MKFRGPSSSLNPAREAARQQARRINRTPRGSGSSGGGSSAVYLNSPVSAMSASQPAPSDWRIHVDDDGRLVATHTPTGTTTVLATPEREDED